MLNQLLFILFAPLVAFVIQVFIGKKLPRGGDWVPTLAVGIGWVLSIMLLVRALGDHDPWALQSFTVEWFRFGAITIPAGLQFDHLNAIMLVVVTTVSFFVHVYSMGYMKGDDHYTRYYGFLGLFTFSMLGLVLVNNLLMLYIGWELVGICSYFLIGHFMHKKSANNAATKAFVVNRIGDLGFLVGILILFTATGGKLLYSDVFGAVAAGEISGGLLTAAGICLFCGAIGKSAQFPLHVWLPDAMEGPTPVSALIHAATMVAAGVYMVGRLFVLFTPEALLVVATIGLITLLLAATIAIAQTDIKKVLAYSTVSQLGYMVMALGVGGYVAGLFHLMTHAAFKALLFLGSGSVIYAMHHEQEMPQYGGLRKKLPITYATWIIATLAISGVPLLSGFYSKDMILADALAFGHSTGPWWAYIFFIVSLLAAGMTAFYKFRATHLTFHGQPRNKEKYDHAHESPGTMTAPLIILAVLSIIAGGLPFGTMSGWYGNFIQKPSLEAYAEHGWIDADAIEHAADVDHATDPGHVADAHASDAHAGDAPAGDTRAGEPGEAHSGGISLAADGRGADVHAADDHAEDPHAADAHVADTHDAHGEHAEHHPAWIHYGAMAMSIFIAGLGILFSFAAYYWRARAFDPIAWGARMPGLYQALLNKWYFDEAYHRFVVDPLLALERGLARFDLGVIDRGIVDGFARVTKVIAFAKGWFDLVVLDEIIINGFGAIVRLFGVGVRQVQTGRVQAYLLAMFAVAIVIFVVRAF